MPKTHASSAFFIQLLQRNMFLELKTKYLMSRWPRCFETQVNHNNIEYHLREMGCPSYCLSSFNALQASHTFTLLVDIFTKFLVSQIYTPFFPNI